ncbi:MAG: protoporphyrinogen oxidase, partial [Clostridia bacterium]|nr:protoporphyrinogen oxidase [Deltaproteobacteria bacterium]
MLTRSSPARTARTTTGQSSPYGRIKALMNIPRHIIVIGAGIAGLTAAFRAKAGGARVTVLEASGSIGGKLHTRHLHGFLVEEAANGWLHNNGVTAALCAEVNIGSAVVTANTNAKRRFLVHKGQLRELPNNPLKLMTSNLLSIGGRMRLAREPFVTARRGRTDESVAELARRRVGEEALQTLVDPMVTGIYAGDPAKLSVGATYPKLAALEQQHGSLVRGMMAAQKQRGESADAVPDQRSMESLHRGMSTLCDALAAQLDDVRLDTAAKTIEKRGERYSVHLENEALDCDRVILAAPAYASADLVRALDETLATELAAIVYNAVSVVALGYRKNEVSRLAGFGFLAPFKENRRLLGTLIDSNVFPNRAPNDYVLTRTMV